MAQTPMQQGDYVRVTATPGKRLLVTVCLWVLALSGALLPWLAAYFWRRLAAFGESGSCANLVRGFLVATGAQVIPIACTVVAIHDAVLLAVDVDVTGLRVKRWFRPFCARWDEIREISLLRAPRRDQVLVLTARGSFGLSKRLIGPTSFTALIDLLVARAGAKVRELSTWRFFRVPLVTILAVTLVGIPALLLVEQLLGRFCTP
jgi:hypothetical protein